MKYNFILILIIFLIAGCVSSEEGRDMSGIYRIESSSRKNAKTDTLIATQNQFKLYTDKYYAYANLTNDSNVVFGIGYYNLKGNHLNENNLFSTSKLDSSQSYELNIERTDLGYRQIIEKIKIEGLNTRLIEDYVSIPAAGSTVLDGTWKLISFCKVLPNSRTCEQRVQYKVFHKGYFMFLQGIKNGNDYRKSFGFGHFDYNNDTLIETNLFTSFTKMADQQVNINVKFINEDEFEQTISSDLDSVTVVERYKKLKQ